VPVDSGLAALSDRLFIATLVVYTLAMVAFAVEYAFGGRGRVAATTPARASSRQLVGAGAPVRASTPATPLTPPTAPAPAPPANGIGRLALGLTLLGWALHVGSLTARGASVDRVPWGNMYEFSSAVALLAVTAYLVLLTRQPVRYLGAFVLLPVVLWLGLAGTVLYTEAAPLQAVLNSYWLKIHVSSAVVATGVFMVASVVTALYLLRDRYETASAAGRRAGFPVALAARLPAAATLDRTAYRLIAFAFPIWTFAIIAGAIWAEASWSRYWGWDPKETWSFIAWVVYAAYLHARATAGWKGRRAAGIALLGFAAMTVNYFVVNIVIVGLHSYAS